MKYEVTDRKALTYKLQRNGLFLIDSEVRPGIVYAIDGGEIGVINPKRKYAYRLTIEEAREGAAEMENRIAGEEVRDIAELAEWKRNR